MHELQSIASGQLNLDTYINSTCLTKINLFAERKSDGVKVHHEKKRGGVRVHHEKERWGESLP